MPGTARLSFVFVAISMLIAGPSFADHPDLRHAPNPLIVGDSATLFFSSATSFVDGTAVSLNGQSLTTTPIDGTALAVTIPTNTVAPGENPFQITEPGGGTTSGSIISTGPPGTPADYLAIIQVQASEISSFVEASLLERLDHDLALLFPGVGSDGFAALVRRTTDASAHFGQELRRKADDTLRGLHLKFDNFLTDYFQTHREEMTPEQFQHFRVEADSTIRTARLAIDGFVTSFLRILPDLRTKLEHSKTVTDCTITIAASGPTESGEGGPNGFAGGNTASVAFKFKGHVDQDCLNAGITYRVRITAAFVDAQGKQARTQLISAPGGRLEANKTEYLTDRASVAFDRGQALREMYRIQRDQQTTLVNRSTRLEIYGTIYDKCGCVAETTYRAKFPEFFDYQVVRNAQDRPVEVPYLSQHVTNVDDFSDGAHGLPPCQIALDATGGLVAIQPKEGDKLPAIDVTGALIIAAAFDPDCTPGHIEILQQSLANRSQLFLIVEIDGKDVPLQMNGTIDPAQSGDLPQQAMVSVSVKFAAGDVAAAVTAATKGDAGKIAHAYETMRARLSVHAWDSCGCEVVVTFTFGPKKH